MDSTIFSKSNPLIAEVRQGRFITPWWLALPLCPIILEVISPLQGAVVDFLLPYGGNLLDAWNIFDLFAVSIAACSFFLWVGLVEGRPISTMGLPRKNAFSEFSKGFVIGAIMISAIVGILVLLGALQFDRMQFTASTLFSWFLVLIGYIIQGSTEEFYIRGWLLPVLSQRLSVQWALFLSSTIFSVIHLGNNGVSLLSSIQSIFFAAFLGVFALKKGNIWGVCGIHVAWNFFQGNVFGLFVSGFDSEASLFYFTPTGSDLLTGGAYGPEGGIPCLILFTGAFLYCLFYMKTTWQEQRTKTDSIS